MNGGEFSDVFPTCINEGVGRVIWGPSGPYADLMQAGETLEFEQRFNGDWIVLTRADHPFSRTAHRVTQVERASIRLGQIRWVLTQVLPKLRVDEVPVRA